METITRTLAMEHAVFRDVFAQMEKILAGAPSLPEVKVLATVAEGLLRDHGEAETNLAYAALDHALADRKALHRLYQDHREIDERFRLIHRATDPAEAQRLLKKTLASTRDHFRREEKNVFPLLEQTLQPETLVTLGRNWMESRAVAAA